MPTETTQPAEATIRADAPVITLVNVFSVAPENQDRLVEILDAATADVMRHRAGFVSANIHRSLDGTKVINYAQWKSEEDFRAMLGDPRARAHMDQIGPIATAEPTLCQVISVHHA